MSTNLQLIVDNALVHTKKHEKIYDWSPKRKAEIIKEQKIKFRDECLKDDTLSVEYKNYVSDLDNISVTIGYGADISFALDSISVSAHFLQTTKGMYKSGVSGTATFDSNGNLITSNLHNEYSDYENTTEHNETYRIRPKSSETFTCGTVMNKDGMIELSPNDPKPDGFKKARKALRGDMCSLILAFAKRNTSINPYLIEEVKSSHPRAFNIEQKDVENFEISTRGIEIAYVPTNNFDIDVYYKGEHYGNNQKPRGECSKECEDYENYIMEFRLGNKLALALIAISALVTFAFGITNVALIQPTHKVLFYIVAVIYGIASTVVALILIFTDPNYPEFTKDVSLDELKKQVVKEERKHDIVANIISWIIALVTIVIFFVFAL